MKRKRRRSIFYVKHIFVNSDTIHNHGYFPHWSKLAVEQQEFEGDKSVIELILIYLNKMLRREKEF